MRKRILKRVAKVFEITPEELISTSRKQHLIDARLCYFLSMSILGVDIHKANKSLPFTHTMPTFYVTKATTLFKLYKSFRTRIKTIVSHFNADRFEQFERENPYTSDEVKALSRNIILPKKERKMYFTNVKEVAIQAGYTDEDNKQIDFACEMAEKFFKTYGKGLEKMPIVDRRRYY